MIESQRILVHTVKEKGTRKELKQLPVPQYPIDELEYYDDFIHVVGQFEDISEALTAEKWLQKKLYELRWTI